MGLNVTGKSAPVQWGVLPTVLRDLTELRECFFSPQTGWTGATSLHGRLEENFSCIVASKRREDGRNAEAHPFVSRHFHAQPDERKYDWLK